MVLKRNLDTAIEHLWAHVEPKTITNSVEILKKLIEKVNKMNEYDLNEK